MFSDFQAPHRLPLDGSSIRRPPTAGAVRPRSPEGTSTPLIEGDFTEVPLAQLTELIPAQKDWLQKILIFL